LCDNICMVWLGGICLSNFFQCFVKMNENQWMYDNIISEEPGVKEENEKGHSVNEENGKESSMHKYVDYSDVFNTFQVLIWFFVVKLSKWMSLED